MFTGAAHIAKLLKSDEPRGAAGPVQLLSQLLLSELPAPSKARYPPIPPSASLKISSVFVQLGVVDHLRQRLVDATEALRSPSRQANGLSHPLRGLRCFSAGLLRPIHLDFWPCCSSFWHTHKRRTIQFLQSFGPALWVRDACLHACLIMCSCPLLGGFHCPFALNGGFTLAGGEQEVNGVSLRGQEALAAVVCEALSLFAVNSASHRSLQAAATFQTTLTLLGASPECHVSMETEARVSHWHKF